MKEGRGVTRFVMLLAVFAVILLTPCFVYAASAVDQLQQSITEKKAAIDSLNSQLNEYRRKIQELSGKSASLQNDIALLENGIAMSKLDIAATQNTIDQETLELRIIDNQIAQTELALAKRRAMLSDILFAINKEDSQSALDVVLKIQSVGDVFEAATQLASVNGAIKNALEATKLTQRDLVDRQLDHEAKVQALGEVQIELTKKISELEMRMSAKEVLARATSDSENQYRTLMSEVRSEQQSITNEIAKLQDAVQDKLKDSVGFETGETRITWPVHGIITTLFHDPTYPFRNLFEHSGLDIAVPQGTAIEAAAPGYVARVYKGDMYGYYVMIIHANGFATLYAHMSRIDVEQDQYVSRGQVIGLSGGRPGTLGAGFSTGPHVHFEVRLNGIPVNPLAYMDINQL